MSKFPGRLITDLADTGYSVYFDGTGDFLSVANNAAFSLASSAFTVEAWVYFTDVSAQRCIVSTYGSATTGWSLQYLSTSGFITWSNGDTNLISGTSTIRANQWYHIAVSGTAGTATRLFVNGVQESSTVASNLTNSTAALQIGRVASVGPMLGYIANVRVIKGTALYTANFTPPTQLFNVTNTSLLTCNSPAIIDQSNNAFAITVNGDSKVSTLTPFTAYVPYNPALGASTPGVWTLDEALQAKGTRRWNMYDPSFNQTTLLLHGNGTNGAQNNTFVDSSSNAFPITRNPASGPNAPTQGSFSPFSQTGWGNFFNGSTDFLTLPSTSSLSFGTGDFCVEFWLYRTGTTGGIFSNSQNVGGGDTQFEIALNGSNRVILIGWNTTFMTGATTINTNIWYHIAVVRSGTSMAIFVNGTRDAATTSANNFSSTNAFLIGAQAGGSGRTIGYISNLRAVKGASVYNPSNLNITVPTVPLGATSGGQTPPTGTQTSLLTCQSNRFVDNGTANSGSGFAITVSGTPSVQPFSPFYPTAAYTPATVGGSGYFDGTGDYLSFTNNTSTNLGTGDFTFEAWVYPVALSSFNMLFAAGGANNYFALKWGATSSIFGLNAYNGTQDVTSSSLTTPINQWTHIAFVRISGTIYFYINGVAAGSGAFTSAWGTSTGTATIGFNATYAGQYFVNGYISNLRVVKGTAVYTGAFTPPRAPLATSGSASASAYSSTTNVNTSFASSETSLLCNFTNAGIVDSTAKNVLETVGNAQISTTQSVFGGTSMSFNGTNSTLLLRNSQLMNLGSSDFTLEFWMYRSAATASQPFYSLSGSSQTNSLALDMNASGGLLAYATASGGAVWSILNGSSFGTVPLTTWTHVALVRNGSTWRGYLNGVAGFTVTNSSALASFDGASIGSSGVSTLWFNGFIDDFRITRFARYTANFTPQTSQWQDE